ncbi:MAG TPA: acylphosphatase [Egibacteraceae bacterium]
MERKRVHVVVHGIVQGVFFRGTLADHARRRGVAGWVRNTLEGTVEAELEGPAEAVDALVAFCHEGPPAAVVERVEVRDIPVTGERGFTIR